MKALQEAAATSAAVSVIARGAMVVEFNLAAGYEASSPKFQGQDSRYRFARATNIKQTRS